LTNLPKYTAVAQVLVDGIPSNPFTIRTLPPAGVPEDRYDSVRRASARQYARPAAIAAELVRREFGYNCDDHADLDAAMTGSIAYHAFAEHTKTAASR
jgi:hypothetical protein